MTKPKLRAYPYDVADEKTLRSKAGFIDARGKRLCKATFDSISGANDDDVVEYYVASKHNERVYFDMWGNELFTRHLMRSVTFGPDGIGASWRFDGSRYRAQLVARDGHETDVDADDAMPLHEDRAIAVAHRGDHLMPSVLRPAIEHEHARPYGFVDGRGRMVIAPAFALASNFRDGIAAVAPLPAGTKKKSAPRWGVIDKSGAFLCEPQLALAFAAGEGRIAFAASTAIEARWGLATADGAVVVKPRFANAPVFRHGLARVAEKGVVGFVDENGEWIVPPTYADASHMIGDVFAFAVQGKTKSPKWGLAKKSGEVVVAASHAGISTFGDVFRWTGPYRRTKHYDWGYLSVRGEMFWSRFG